MSDQSKEIEELQTKYNTFDLHKKINKIVDKKRSQQQDVLVETIIIS